MRNALRKAGSPLVERLHADVRAPSHPEHRRSLAMCARSAASVSSTRGERDDAEETGHDLAHVAVDRHAPATGGLEGFTPIGSRIRRGRRCSVDASARGRAEARQSVGAREAVVVAQGVFGLALAKRACTCSRAADDEGLPKRRAREDEAPVAARGLSVGRTRDRHGATTLFEVTSERQIDDAIAASELRRATGCRASAARARRNKAPSAHPAENAARAARVVAGQRDRVARGTLAVGIRLTAPHGGLADAGSLVGEVSTERGNAGILRRRARRHGRGDRDDDDEEMPASDVHAPHR
jgi:hypothetical protein